MDPDILADNILKAAGSGLRCYSIQKTRDAILKAATDAIKQAQQEAYQKGREDALNEKNDPKLP